MTQLPQCPECGDTFVPFRNETMCWDCAEYVPADHARREKRKRSSIDHERTRTQHKANGDLSLE